jgi:hypothetical protein
MNAVELHKVYELIDLLDGFAAETPMSRGWHVQWQEKKKYVKAQIHGLLECEVKDDAGS